MKFCYKLHGIGWAAINIEINRKQYWGWPSYLTEPLHDLVYGLLSLLKGCVPDDELMHEVTFRLKREPAIDKFELTCVKENILRIKI